MSSSIKLSLGNVRRAAEPLNRLVVQPVSWQSVRTLNDVNLCQHAFTTQV